jgi:hypothetical protein
VVSNPALTSGDLRFKSWRGDWIYHAFSWLPSAPPENDGAVPSDRQQSLSSILYQFTNHPTIKGKITFAAETALLYKPGINQSCN